AARAAVYSRCHFSKVFKEQVGVGFVEYLTGVRIRHAMRLLATTDLTVTGVAFEVGFRDLSHFERVFRRRRQQTPSQYRAEARAAESGPADGHERSGGAAPGRPETLVGGTDLLITGEGGRELGLAIRRALARASAGTVVVADLRAVRHAGYRALRELLAAVATAHAEHE